MKHSGSILDEKKLIQGVRYTHKIYYVLCVIWYMLYNSLYYTLHMYLPSRDQAQINFLIGIF